MYFITVGLLINKSYKKKRKNKEKKKKHCVSLSQRVAAPACAL